MKIKHLIWISLIYAPLLAADNPQIHPLEKYCVYREATGMMVGTSVECSCEWGYKRYENQDMVMSVGGMEIPNRQIIIQIGPEITSYNPDTMQGTVTQNPMYEAYVNSDASDDPMETMQQIMEGMGSTFTGDTKEVAGYSCQIVTNPTIGDMCVSDDGIVLEMNLMGGTMEQVATQVEIGDCGDENNYIVPDGVTISDTPDLTDLMNQLQNMQNPE